MPQIIESGLTFDDVLLVPRRSPVSSRKDVDLTTKLTKKISLKIPIVSANMDTVTESRMATTMALEGGVGFIHRFLSVENQVEEILKVKRSESIIIDHPYTISREKKVKDALELMESKGVSGLLVVHNDRLAGILTHRDVLFNSIHDQRIEDIMTKKPDLVTARHGISIEEARNILQENKIEKLPLVDEDGRVTGLITSKDMIKATKFPFATKDKKGRLVVGAAIGVKKGFLERAEALLAAGTDFLVVDIAHGHSDLAINAIKELRLAYSGVEIVAGNVATAEGTEELIRAGADTIKIGVGPGTMCTTRIVTGAGVPQLTAIINCSSVAKDHDVPTIADGGIRTSGDITKALAAGAHTIMLGGLLAGTDESPGTTLIKDGAKYKMCRGMASFTANADRREKENMDQDMTDFMPEGVEAIVPYRGSAVELIRQLVGGLRSGFSYCGARNMEELHKNAAFMKISEASRTESRPHDVKQL